MAARKIVRWCAALAALSIGGCHSCSNEERLAAAGPTMPRDMLVPRPSSSAGEAAEGSALRVAHHVKAGPWAELQRARPDDHPDRTVFEHWRDDSAFLSIDAMTLLHEAFARALPGFDLFLPRLFGGDALRKLAIELDAFALRSTGDIAATAREVATMAKDATAKGEALWVLGI